MKRLEKAFLLVLIFSAVLSNAQTKNSEKESKSIETKTNYANRYFYFPNLQAYFDSSEKVYYYKLGGNWTSSEELPKNYGGYSIYNKIKVAIADFNQDNPDQYLQIHKKMFPYSSKGRFANTVTSDKSVVEN